MREDLPFEEPLPDLWSISLAVGGDLVGGGPCLEDYNVLECLQLELDRSRCRYWRVEGASDHNGDSRHVLCEHRFHLPERLAIPQLGRLRELMLREARLLDSLSHECVVPLERGWLEQRAGAQPTDEFLYETHPKLTAGALTKNLDRPPAATPESATAENLPNGTCPYRESSRFHGYCTRHPRLSSPAAVRCGSCAAARGAGGERESADPSCFLDGGALRGQNNDNDAAAFLLRSCVPMTVADVDDDEDSEEEGGGLSGNGSAVSERGVKRFGYLEQDRWGGDDTTDWRGIAEPKLTAAGGTEVGLEVSGVAMPPSAQPLDEERCDPAVDQGCAFRNDRREDAGDDSRASRQQKRTLRLASYLLLPDWLPLRLWFETEFRPRTAAAPGAREGPTVAVSAAEDWVTVWRHLVRMFLQVVRGVDHLHTQGVVHNNIHPGSVWVSTDGTCRVGGVGQATPPGSRRPPPPADLTRHHFCSPEQRRGSKVDSHSDVYSLGVLMLEFWCNYLSSRGLGNLGSVRDGRVVDLVRSGGSGAALQLQPKAASTLLDAALVSRMLADDSFDRPDCFEILDELAESNY